MEGFLLKKNLEFHTRTQGRDSRDFSGYQVGLHGGGKGDFHRYFLTDWKALAGFDKRAAGADIADLCLEVAVPGLALRGRKDLAESFPAVVSFFDTLYSLFFKKQKAHFENQ